MFCVAAGIWTAVSSVTWVPSNYRNSLIIQKTPDFQIWFNTKALYLKIVLWFSSLSASWSKVHGLQFICMYNKLIETDWVIYVQNSLTCVELALSCSLCSARVTLINLSSHLPPRHQEVTNREVLVFVTTADKSLACNFSTNTTIKYHR